MKKLVVFSILISFLTQLNCASNKDSCFKNKVEAFTMKRDANILYKTKNNYFKKKLPITEGGYLIEIIGEKNNLFLINFRDTLINNVFIKKNEIGINTRNYNNEDIPIYSDFKKMIISDYLVGEQTVQIFKICEGWAFIRGNGRNGKTVNGWLSPEMQCGNPYTTCP